MNKDESRQIVLDIVTPFFYKKGLQLYSEPELNDMFYMNLGEDQISYGFYFKHSLWHSFFKTSISIGIVEKILNEIYERGDDDSIIKNFTIYDSKTILGYEPAHDTSSKRVETEFDARNMAREIITYVENIGQPFSLKYSHLPNTLEEMNNLEKQGKNWNGLYGEGGIICGGFESNIKGLIISKLCNDFDYVRKYQFVNGKAKLKPQWLPYLEKLKERLKTVEPIYNV